MMHPLIISFPPKTGGRLNKLVHISGNSWQAQSIWSLPVDHISVKVVLQEEKSVSEKVLKDFDQKQAKDGFCLDLKWETMFLQVIVHWPFCGKVSWSCASGQKLLHIRDIQEFLASSINLIALYRPRAEEEKLSDCQILWQSNICWDRPSKWWTGWHCQIHVACMASVVCSNL